MIEWLVQFLAILAYYASLIAFVVVINIVALAVLPSVRQRFRGAPRIGGGARPQAPPRSVHAPLIPYDRETRR